MADKIIYDRLREINPNSQAEILGTGFAFPVVLNDAGSIKMTVGEENVKSGIFHIATYRHGDLYGSPTFGSNLPALVFSVFSSDRLRMHEEWMKNALEAWEPRVTEVRVTAGKNTDETSDSKVTMLVQYQVRSTGTEDYSLIPVEEG